MWQQFLGGAKSTVHSNLFPCDVHTTQKWLGRHMAANQCTFGLMEGVAPSYPRERTDTTEKRKNCKTTYAYAMLINTKEMRNTEKPLNNPISK